MQYPKINSLFKREFKGDRKLIIGDYSCPEFESIDRWTITEKVDGTNIRITMNREYGNLNFGGRTEESQIPCKLLEVLLAMFPYEKMCEVFPKAQIVRLFGEGYGGNIQAGSYYGEIPSFILFDAVVDGYWLERKDLEDVAKSLGIKCVPLIKIEPHGCKDGIIRYVKLKPGSELTNHSHPIEGIVARTYPQMLFRNTHEPIMFKLKCKDFE